MINVLICDESMSDVEDLMGILDFTYGVGMRTRIFYKTSDALAYVTRRRGLVDLCFFELVMQEMNGIELARALRADGYKGDIVFISRDKTFGAETFEVKALSYLLKPIMPEDVRCVVENWKARRKCNL